MQVLGLILLFITPLLGLSYTTFTYSHIPSNADGTSAGEQPLADVVRVHHENKTTGGSVLLTLHVRVTNTGPLTGATPVFAYISPPNGTAGVLGQPLRSLVSFDKLNLAPQESGLVHFHVREEHVGVLTESGERQPLAGVWRMWVGGNNHDGFPVHLEVSVGK